MAALLASLLLLLTASLAAAQPLPVKTYPTIRAFQGERDAVIARDEVAEYVLVSAHKEGGRPWADALFERRSAEGRMLVNRAYDCAAGTYRWMGEARTFRGLSLSVKSLDQVRDRRLESGSVEYALARYVCGL